MLAGPGHGSQAEAEGPELASRSSIPSQRRGILASGPVAFWEMDLIFSHGNSIQQSLIGSGNSFLPDGPVPAVGGCVHSPRPLPQPGFLCWCLSAQGPSDQDQPQPHGLLSGGRELALLQLLGPLLSAAGQNALWD